ncbi:hypothetical protein HWV62_45210 [Athelia sp. TMB]|nr:hypothetical protein HWV62_45210 [Athelia sp. TMB]
MLLTSVLFSRIPFILSNAVAFHIALTPPNEPPSQSEQAAAKVDRMEQIYASMQSWLPHLNRLFYMTLTLVECAAILRAIAPNSTLASLVSTGVPALHSKPTLIFLLGWALATTGAALRAVCYRAMGRLFTFELSIRKNHALITHGPYAWVRHPSYTGFFLFMGGIYLCQLCPGALLGDWIGGLGLETRRLMCAVGVVQEVMQVKGVVGRAVKEDEMMKGEFGRDWDEWARRVPARLVPFVF